MNLILIVCVLVIGVCVNVYGYGALSSQEYHGDYYAYPKYTFEYGVKDPKTGDDKEQWEERDGDKITGGYKFKEADGTYRVVKYTADKHNGFNAVVQTIGKAIHPQVYKTSEQEGDYERSYGYEH